MLQGCNIHKDWGVTGSLPGGGGSLRLGVFERNPAAFNELSVSGFAYVLFVLDDDFATRQNCFCHTLDFHAFVAVEVDIHVVGLG